MKRYFLINTLVAAILAFFVATYAQEINPIQLPKPQTEGGKPLMQALKERKSTRDFSPKELPMQVISNLLWAACGVNRPESGGMTAPTAMHMQEIDIYVAKKDGLYLYDAKKNQLIPILPEDIREVTGRQSFVKDAPVNLVFVANFSRMPRLSPETADFYAATDTGFISQNVYLYCASEGLVTVVRGMFDSLSLSKAMKLTAGQKVILAQTVGYPK